MFDLPPADAAWDARRLEALARSMLDGLSVWVREIRRPEVEHSPSVIRHEAERASRMADLWEAEIEHPWMRGALNLAQITLGCALGPGAGEFPIFTGGRDVRNYATGLTASPHGRRSWRLRHNRSIEDRPRTEPR